MTPFITSLQSSTSVKLFCSILNFMYLPWYNYYFFQQLFVSKGLYAWLNFFFDVSVYFWLTKNVFEGDPFPWEDLPWHHPWRRGELHLWLHPCSCSTPDVVAACNKVSLNYKANLLILQFVLKMFCPPFCVFPFGHKDFHKKCNLLINTSKTSHDL